MLPNFVHDFTFLTNFLSCNVTFCGLTYFPDTVTHEYWSYLCFIQYIFRFFYTWPIYTNFFRWTHATWFLTFTKLLTVTAVTYIVGLSRTWYARLLFLVFLRAVKQKQETNNQMKARPTYCNFSETSVPYPLPVPYELQEPTTPDNWKAPQ